MHKWKSASYDSSEVNTMDSKAERAGWLMSYTPLCVGLAAGKASSAPTSAKHFVASAYNANVYYAY